MDQDQFFSREEGDNFYRRNKVDLQKKLTQQDPIIDLIDEYSLQPESILDLGCADGWRLTRMREKYGAVCAGVDVSEEAINAGINRDSELDLRKSTLASLPFGNAHFDLIIISYVFCWVSRDSIFTACSEADRVLADSGVIIVSDFSPDIPCKRHYHHAPTHPIYTFKQNYSEIFTSTNIYKELSRVSVDTSQQPPKYNLNTDNQNRGSITMLKKSLSNYYMND